MNGSASTTRPSGFPAKLPLMWRLTFGIFALVGVVRLSGLGGASGPAGVAFIGATGATLLAAGVLGLKRHSAAVPLSLLILAGTALAPLGPLLLTDHFVANEVDRLLATLGALGAVPAAVDEAVRGDIVLRMEKLYWGAAALTMLVQGWMCIYLWKRRHWFGQRFS